MSFVIGRRGSGTQLCCAMPWQQISRQLATLSTNLQVAAWRLASAGAVAMCAAGAERIRRSLSDLRRFTMHL